MEQQTTGIAKLDYPGEDIIVTGIKCKPTDRVEIIGRNILVLCGDVHCVDLKIRATGSVVLLPHLIANSGIHAHCPNGKVINGFGIDHPRQDCLWQMVRTEIEAGGSHVFLGAEDSENFRTLLCEMEVPEDQIAAILSRIPQKICQSLP